MADEEKNTETTQQKKGSGINAMDFIAGGAGAGAGWFVPDLFWDKPTYVQRGVSSGLLGLTAIVLNRMVADSIASKEKQKPTKLQRTVNIGTSTAQGALQNAPLFGAGRSQQQNPDAEADLAYRIGQGLMPLSHPMASLYGAGTAYGGSLVANALHSKFAPGIDTYLRANYRNPKGFTGHLLSGFNGLADPKSRPFSLMTKSRAKGMGAMAYLFNLIAALNTPSPYAQPAKAAKESK